MSESDRPQKGKKKNTAVYVTGLPTDATVDEVHEHFKRCGVVMDDMFKGGPRIKLYQDEMGNLKGDGLVVYLLEESVSMAVEMLDQWPFRPDCILTVQPAAFSEKREAEDDDQGSKLGAKRVDKRLWKKQMQQMKNKLGWYEEERPKKAEKYDKIVVLRNMFTQAELEADPAFILDLKQDILEECERLGKVTSVHVLDESADGICSVKFKDAEAAQLCLKLMNGRFFAGQRISAALYDGSFKIRESSSHTELPEERSRKYSEWLEQEEERTQSGSE